MKEVWDEERETGRGERSRHLCQIGVVAACTRKEMTKHFRSQTSTVHPASIQAATNSAMLVELEKISREVTTAGEAKSLTSLHEPVKICVDQGKE